MFVSSAVKIGFMVGETRGRDYALSLEHVLTFQKRYVVSRELRETLGGHQRAICCQLDGAGFRSVATINGTRVWLRSEIEKFIEKQIDTRAASD